MASTIMILNEEANLTAPTSVERASLVRILNSGTAAVKVTQKTAEGDVVSSFTMRGGEVVFLRKDINDTLEGGAALLVSKAAFKW